VVFERRGVSKVSVVEVSGCRGVEVKFGDLRVEREIFLI